MEEKIKKLKWFTDRINKKVYRDKTSCECKSCNDGFENGIIISNESHASYLHMIENDYASEGVFLNYRDKK